MSAETYISQVDIPKEWIDEIESIEEKPLQDEVNRQRSAFIKKYYGKKSNADIFRVLGISERAYYRKIKRMKKRGEL